MDRANNAVGLRIGGRATSPDDVLAMARQEIERAYEIGAGVRGSADWMPPARWEDPSIGGEGADNWPPRDWPDLAADPEVRAYIDRRLQAPQETFPKSEDHEGGPVNVRPHMRDGHPVSGYIRSPPHR